MKTHTKHTPGPWRSRGHRITGRDGSSFICDCRPSGPNHGITGIEQAQNEKLIAAAPDLLAACKQVLIASEDNGGMDDIDWQGIRDAIAKAEGN